MFNLEKSISEWRQEMLAAGIQTPAPLEELESHLREDVKHRVRSGLSEQQAFEAAVQQIGISHVLKTEFAKTSLLNSRRMAGFRPYMIVINLILAALLTTPEVVTQLLMFVPLQLLYETSIWIARYAECSSTKWVEN